MNIENENIISEIKETNQKRIESINNNG